jgi:hypothetical protein
MGRIRLLTSLSRRNREIRSGDWLVDVERKHLPDMREAPLYDEATHRDVVD